MDDEDVWGILLGFLLVLAMGLLGLLAFVVVRGAVNWIAEGA